MAQSTHTPEVPKYGQPAPIARLFGWFMIAALGAFLINNVLIVAYEMPTAMAFLSDGFSLNGMVTPAIYLIAFIIAAYYVLTNPDHALRYDAAKLHRFNTFVVRAMFWSVFFVGVADAIVAFMRVENIFVAWLGEEQARAFGRSAFVAPYVHMPMIALGIVFAMFTRTLGFTWLALLIVAAELLIVLSRFIFSYEQAFMGDLVRYWYAALFLFASAYTLYEEGHVRVDLIYAGLNNRKKGSVNAIGTVLCGLTTAWVILIVGMAGKTSMINAPIRTFEVSQAGFAGMYIKYQMAVFIGLFAITMLIQFVSYYFDAVADRRDEPGRREISPVSH